MTLTVLSAIRVIYFIYVLAHVCRTSQSFWRRPAFMNWLPICNLVYALSVLLSGSYLLYWTWEGDGQVICEISGSTVILTVVGTLLCGVCHFMFSSEFLCTYFALSHTIKGLTISCQGFLKKRDSLISLDGENSKGGGATTSNRLSRAVQLEMIEHIEKAEREIRRLKIGLWCVLAAFVLLGVGGIYDFAISIIAFCLILIVATLVYFWGLLGVKSIVARF